MSDPSNTRRAQRRTLAQPRLARRALARGCLPGHRVMACRPPRDRATAPRVHPHALWDQHARQTAIPADPLARIRLRDASLHVGQRVWAVPDGREWEGELGPSSGYSSCYVYAPRSSDFLGRARGGAVGIYHLSDEPAFLSNIHSSRTCLGSGERLGGRRGRVDLRLLLL